MDSIKYIDISDQLRISESRAVADIASYVIRIIPHDEEFLVDSTSDPKLRFARYHQDKKNRWKQMYVLYHNTDPNKIKEYENRLIQIFKSHPKNRNRPRNTQHVNRRGEHLYIFILTK